jgi:hypothetical protein
MAKAVKDHRSKKNSSANEAFNRRRAALNQGDTTHFQFQRIFRINCLKQRAAEGRLTEKNQKEIASLGITV